MYYADGQDVKLGDIVRLGNGESGVVVCSIDSNEYSDEYTEADWSCLKNGAMIIFANDGLMHYEDTSDLVLVSRKQNIR
jgi:hypothetical protein